MPRETPYSLQKVWRHQTANPYDNKSYFWVIVGVGDKLDSKVVKMVYDPFPPNIHAWEEGKRKERQEAVREYDFQHSHIKKYAVLFDTAKFIQAQLVDTLLQAVIEEREKLDYATDTKRVIALEQKAWGLWAKYQSIVMDEQAFMNLHGPDIQEEIRQQRALVA